MSATNTIIEVPVLPACLLAEIVSDLPIHDLVLAVIGNRFWTEGVLPLLPRLTVTRINDLVGDSAIQKSLKKNVTSLVWHGDNVYTGDDEHNDLFRQIASFESVVHLRLLNLGTPNYIQLDDFTKYLLNRMAPQLKSLVMDGVHFHVYKYVDFEEFGDFLKKITNCQPLEFRKDSQVQCFQVQYNRYGYWGKQGPLFSTSMLMSVKKPLPEKGPDDFVLRMKLL
jgi:hypothetical protein